MILQDKWTIQQVANIQGMHKQGIGYVISSEIAVEWGQQTEVVHDKPVLRWRVSFPINP